MRLNTLLKIKEARLFRLERRLVRLNAEVSYLKDKQHEVVEEIESEFEFDDFINDERLAQC